MLLIEPETLAGQLDDDNLVIIDLGKESLFQQLHVPNALFMHYGELVSRHGEAHGLLPDTDHLVRLFSRYGIDNSKTVVAYDDEGGGKAARLIWTLHCLGFHGTVMLNGGIHAWANEPFPSSQELPAISSPADFSAEPDAAPVADSQYIATHLEDPNVVLLDARSSNEYNGTQRFARRGGHIPGAIHFEWSTAMDTSRNLRLRPAEMLHSALESLGVTPEKQVICYCQTHHRSSYLYLVLKHLGYEDVKGYPGSWSDWGNQPDLPVEL